MTIQHTDTTLWDRARTVLDDLRDVAVELTTAIADRPGWDRLDGTTFVAAGRPADGDGHYHTIIGRPSGWWLITSAAGEQRSSERLDTADTALQRAHDETVTATAR